MLSDPDWSLSPNLPFVFLCLFEKMVYRTGHDISSFEIMRLFLIKSRVTVDLPQPHD